MVSILKNMGTSHNELLNKKCKLIWEWYKSTYIFWLFPVYVNTKHNLPDEPSRKIYSQGEWMLARTIFSKALRFNSFDQSKLQFYAFPPFSCISQCIQKIKTDKGEGILVIPH